MCNYFVNILGMEYDNCGTSCPKTCTGLDYNCEDHHCIDGCHCPADKFLQDGVCLEKSDCPCMFGNKVCITFPGTYIYWIIAHIVMISKAYAPKSKIRRDCNQCVCSRGKWICTRNVCDGVCRTYGDRHYQTFDGATYNMRVDSDCSYILARSSELETIPFEISVENKKCTWEQFFIVDWSLTYDHSCFVIYCVDATLMATRNRRCAQEISSLKLTVIPPNSNLAGQSLLVVKRFLSLFPRIILLLKTLQANIRK